MKLVVGTVLLISALGLISPVFAQAPTPTVVDSPSVKVLTGLLAPQFQEEMNFITQELGVNCMTRGLNKQFFPDHQSKEGESVLGRVTCYTCHQGDRTPKLPPGH
jgi:hypothetical protein